MIRQFTFAPSKLAKAAAEMAGKFPDEPGERYVRHAKKVNIDALLARIAQLAGSRLLDFSSRLVSLELFALVQALRTVTDEDLTQKVVTVLEHRFQPGFGPPAWRIYQERLLEPALRLIRLAGERDKELSRRLGVEDAWSDRFHRGLKGEEPAAVWAQQVVQGGVDVDEAFGALAIRPGTLLHTRLLVGALKGATRKFLLAQRPGRLVELAGSLALDDLIEFAERYLLKLKPDDYADDLMKLLLEGLGDPDQSLNWTKLNPEARERFREWYFRFELRRFFSGSRADPERLAFWENVVEHLAGMKTWLRPPVLFLFFDRFVVVEFGEKGNAAYIYALDTFDRYFRRFLEGHFSIRNVSDLKDRDVARKVLYHQAGWQLKVLRWLRSWLR